MRYALPDMDYIHVEVHDNPHGYGIYVYNMHNFYVRLLTCVVAELMNVSLPQGYRPQQRTREEAEKLLSNAAETNGWEQIGIV